jgi:hypothetical protein
MGNEQANLPLRRAAARRLTVSRAARQFAGGRGEFMVDLRTSFACGPYDRTLRDGRIKPKASS